MNRGLIRWAAMIRAGLQLDTKGPFIYGLASKKDFFSLRLSSSFTPGWLNFWNGELMVPPNGKPVVDRITAQIVNSPEI